MRHPTPFPWRFILAFPLLLALPAPHARPAAPPLPDRAVDFSGEIRPLLSARCLSCHGPAKQKGGLRLDSRAAALRSGAVVPGKGDESPLVQRVLGLGPETRMPPSGAPLSPRQAALLRTWIDQGARWPESAPAVASGDHWAYRPLVRPAVPAVAAPVRNPVDAFVRAKLAAAGMPFAPEADRRSLLRRVTFDLTGLPPSPEEVDAFLGDRSPDAYEKVVDRLLASPGYGERWARHWLDVVHYAETHGHDQDVPRENAWPYRDYLIRAFNADRPYARFVEDQVAGDVLRPDDPDGPVATGMLVAGPWDESSQQSIREDTLDKKVAQTLDRDDMLTTVFSAFASSTVHCARCHDHKFDPISQQEYYDLQSTLAGIDRADRPYDPDPAVGRERLALARRQAELANARPADLLAPAARAAAAALEKRHAGGAVDWVPLVASGVRCANGSVPAKLPDRSVRFGGPRPATEVTTIEAETDREGVTAVRLELLTDPSLPHQGPGRQDNGNLHLNEFRVTAGPRGRPADRKPVAVRRAVADFDQEGWTAAHALDGNPATAWGIYPAVGRSHSAVFVFREPLTDVGGASLAFTLEQTHGGGHLIGRLRLSVTTSPRPAPLSPVPPALAALLATPASHRTDAQKAELARLALQEQIDERRGRLPAPRMVFAAANDFAPNGAFRPARGCRPIQVLRRGDVGQPVAPAVPGALSCVPGLPARFALEKPDDEGQRRAALARWLSDRRNVLTWRSIVNRVWHHHFGRGLVATPGDLGRMGARPTHPELLDWLAVEFRDGGGSLKALHRLLVTSATYRQAVAHHAGNARADADNLLLWRMNRTRLDAECLRDAVLAATGTLDRRMGGPSDKQFAQSPGIHVTPKADYDAFDVDSPASYRRAIYRFVFRTLPDPFLDALDCPDASQFTPVRSNSVTPLQALALLNDRLVVRQAEHLARRVEREAPDPAGRIERAYLLVLGRPPAPRETALLARHAEKHGMANVCRLLFNCNEFVFAP